jgi:hypothetical protein
VILVFASPFPPRAQHAFQNTGTFFSGAKIYLEMHFVSSEHLERPSVRKKASGPHVKGPWQMERDENDVEQRGSSVL